MSCICRIFAAVLKVSFRGSTGLQVGLRELYVPATAKEKVHVDTMMCRLADFAPSFAAKVRRRQIPLAHFVKVPIRCNTAKPSRSDRIYIPPAVIVYSDSSKQPRRPFPSRRDQVMPLRNDANGPRVAPADRLSAAHSVIERM